MKKRDYTPLLAELAEAYSQYAPKSAALNEKAKKYLIDGGSHTLRLIQPFPPRIVAAQGAWIKDEDGHDILDFWQGHLGNVLGHNPEVVTSALARAFEGGLGLQTGFADQLQAETAEILCRRTGAERARFTTSGALATMYAILLARAFTGRDMVMKIGGGWHGAQPWGLKGVGFHDGFHQVEGEGVPLSVTDQVIVTRFNDPDMLHQQFEQYGDRVACFIIEPVPGAGGTMPASLEYLQTVRQLTSQYGAVLIFDEVVSGFRFRAGDVGALYGVRPDLGTFGKAIGGGMPVSAVVGRADIMGLVGHAEGSRVKFSGGTYCAHPASLLAAKTLMTYLVEHEDQVYPRLAELGEKMRRTIEAAFSEEGIYARCLGDGNEALPGSSVTTVCFPYREDARLDKPDAVFDPSVCDVTLSQTVLEPALLLEDVCMIKGHGGASAAHTEADMGFLADACRRVARRVKASY